MFIQDNHIYLMFKDTIKTNNIKFIVIEINIITTHQSFEILKQLKTSSESI